MAETIKTTLPQIMPAGGQVVAVVPQSVEEIFRVARGVIAAGLAPYSLTAKKTPDQQQAAVAITIMAGAELGLPPMVSLRAFTVINGRPALYGDGLVAVIRKSGKLRSLTQGYDHEKQFGWAEAERFDTGEKMRVEFTKQEAVDAGLWDERKTIRNYKNEEIPNPEPWFRWKPRMMMIRARTFVLRDLFADVLGGMTDEYEAREISAPVDITPRDEPAKATHLPEPDEPPPPPPKGGSVAAPESTVPPGSGAAPTTTPADQADDFNDDDSGVVRRTPDQLLDDLKAWFDRANTADDIEETWSDLDVESEFAHDPERMGKAIDMKIAANQRVEQKTGGEVLGARTAEEQAEFDKQVDDLFPGARGA